MQRNRIDFSKDSKLKYNKENTLQGSVKIIEHKNIAKPCSFRLRSIDIERLDIALKKVNFESETTSFNKTNLIRGLIMMAHQASSKKLLNSIRNSL